MADPKLSQALGQDDYKWLFEHLTSDNEAERKDAQQLAGKLTSSEAQEFFDFQHAAHGSSPELHREDNSLLGAPPELAAAGVAGIGGAMMRAGTAGVSKAAAAGKAVVGMAAPAVKYEATKTVLEKFGVPSPLAVVAAMAVAGYKGGGATAEAPVAADTAALRAKATATLARTPEEITDAAIAQGRSAVAPTPPPATDMAGGPSIMTPEATAQRLATVTPKTLNELALAARRNKVQLTAADYGTLLPKVQAGMPPADAVAEFAASKMSPIERLKASPSFAGLPSPEEAEALMDARWQRGELKSPSATLAKKMRAK